MDVTKRLVLRGETLTELTAYELRDVVGGGQSGPTCPVRACLYSEESCLIPTQRGCTPATPD